MNQDLERKYIAFISYRHLPLHMEVATAIHRRIEHYTIPKGLRKDGRKKLGYVFRDQDELPLVGTLSDNIQYALDNSEYLIVICTPETSESLWCLQEITYFLRHHDRDHVLAILADGSPAEAFPKELVEVRDENGELISRAEPLAANIVAESSAGRLRKLKSESLRILAALIGCPYDTLYKREQRYRHRRLAIAAGAALCIAAVFVGMLLERNARIREQLRSAQINESLALASLSESAYRDGDINRAVEYALQALPSEESPRPYVAEAEYALARTLHLYDSNILAFDQSFEQPTAISSMALTINGDRVITADSYKTLRCFDTYSGSLLWTKEVPSSEGLTYLKGPDSVFAGSSRFRVSDGETLWSLEGRYLRQLHFSHNQAHLILAQGYREDFSVRIVKTSSGNTVHTIPDIEDDILDLAVSDNGQFAAVLLNDGSLTVVDTESGERFEAEDALPLIDLMPPTKMLFLDNGDLLVSIIRSTDDTAWVSLYSCSSGWKQRFSRTVDVSQNYYARNNTIMLFEVDLLDASENCIAFGSGKRLLFLDRDSGEITMDSTLPSFITDATLYCNNKTNSVGLVLADGTVTLALETGILSLDIGKYSFVCGFDLWDGDSSHKPYLNSVFALVPQNDAKRISIVRWLNNDDFIPVSGNPAGMKKAMVIPTPSGQKVAVASYDYDTDMLTAAFIDPSQAEPAAVCSMPVEEYLTIEMQKNFCTEDGKIISRGHVYDLAAGKDYDLPADPERDLPYNDEFFAFADPADGSVYSAAVSEGYKEIPILHIWKDTELIRSLPLPKDMVSPEPGADYRCFSAGSAGCVIIGIRRYDSDPEEERNTGYLCCFPEEERWVPLPDLDDERISCCAVGEKQALLAAFSAEKKLCITDLAKGSVRVEIPCDFPAASVCKMLFAEDDRLLMVFPYRGDLQIYDTLTGELLSDIEIRDENSALVGGFSFDRYSRYAVMPSKDGRDLLVLYSSSNNICMFTLDRESLSCRGSFPNVAHYFSGNDRVAVKGADGNIFLCPFYSFEEILAAGEALVSRTAE